VFSKQYFNPECEHESSLIGNICILTANSLGSKLWQHRHK